MAKAPTGDTGGPDPEAMSVREAGRTSTLVQTGYLRLYALALPSPTWTALPPWSVAFYLAGGRR